MISIVGIPDTPVKNASREGTGHAVKKQEAQGFSLLADLKRSSFLAEGNTLTTKKIVMKKILVAAVH